MFFKKSNSAQEIETSVFDSLANSSWDSMVKKAGAGETTWAVLYATADSSNMIQGLFSSEEKAQEYMQSISNEAMANRLSVKAFVIDSKLTQQPQPIKNSSLDIQAALQSLSDSAELFESINLPEEAEVITRFMETIASGQFAMVKEAKKKSKKTKKKKTIKKIVKKLKKPNKTNVFTKNLTPEKQLDNLEHIGWVFNAPGPEIAGIDAGWIFNADKSDCGECSMANDGLEDLKDLNTCKECGFDHDEQPEEAFDVHFPETAKKIKEREEAMLENLIPESGIFPKKIIDVKAE